MAGAIRGGPVKSVKGAKKALKKSSGGNGQWLVRVKEEGITFRPLTEPDGWVEFYEHWDDDKGHYVPCTEDCDYCADGVRVSRRMLLNVVDVDQDKVIPLVLPITATQQLMKKYEKYHTLLDRDYEVTREGTMQDTTYDLTPEPPSKMNLSKYDLLDLWATLEAQMEDSDSDSDDDDDDDDDETPRVKKVKRGSKSSSNGTKKRTKSSLDKKKPGKKKKTLGKSR